jgi:hypothetical protein
MRRVLILALSAAALATAPAAHAATDRLTFVRG